MSNIVEAVKKEIVRLEKMQKKIDDFFCNAPKGCLKWQNKKGKTYYYHQYVDGEEMDRKTSREYIKKENIMFAKALAQKHYFTIARPVVEKNLKELKRFMHNYRADKLEAAYSSLAIPRKQLVVPLQISIEEKRRQWVEETYEKNDMYREGLRYETEQGELVRSKSEVIIANFLYKHRKDILYKYERPLEVMVNGKMKIIYPDFTIFNVHTGKIIYWEHAGRLDDPYYANDFVKKMNTYIANELLPGRDVLLTFESQSNPLDIGAVKQLIKIII